MLVKETEKKKIILGCCAHDNIIKFVTADLWENHLRERWVRSALLDLCYRGFGVVCEGGAVSTAPPIGGRPHGTCTVQDKIKWIETLKPSILRQYFFQVPKHLY